MGLESRGPAAPATVDGRVTSLLPAVRTLFRARSGDLRAPAWLRDYDVSLDLDRRKAPATPDVDLPSVTGYGTLTVKDLARGMAYRFRWAPDSRSGAHTMRVYQVEVEDQTLNRLVYLKDMRF